MALCTKPGGDAMLMVSQMSVRGGMCQVDPISFAATVLALAGRTSGATLINVVPVLGSLVLFMSWVFQQTLLESANGSLREIHDAQTVYKNYQANNAIFNAIMQTADKGEGAREQIRRFQIYNYELGLRDMELLLDEPAKAGLPQAPYAYDTTRDADSMLNVTQDRLGKIQERLAEKENEIIGRKSTFNRVFLGLYAAGSATVLLGSVLSVLTS